jgi:hypothetical protein
MFISDARKLDDHGLCCGRKPMVYKKRRLCIKCNRAYDLEDNEQVPNWAWSPVAGDKWECQTSRTSEAGE